MKTSVKITFYIAFLLLISLSCLVIFACQSDTKAAPLDEYGPVSENIGLNTSNERQKNISPMSFWDDILIEPMAASPDLQLTKNNHATYIYSGSYVNGSWGAIMSNATVIGMTEVNGNYYEYKPSADRLGFSRSINGWYTLVAVKKNIFGFETSRSSEYKVGLDTVKPVLTLRSNNAVINSGSTVGVNVYATATDEFSGIDAIWVLRPGTSSYVAHYGSPLTVGGTYYFYATDRAGNSSATQSVTLDKTAPSVQFFGGTIELSNNAYSNADYLQILAGDTQTGLEAIYVKQPGSSIYVAYTQGSVQFTLEGTYSFYAKDKGGNTTSIFTATLDRTAPSITVQHQGVSLGNGAHVNRTQVNVYAGDTNPLTIYYKRASIPNTTYTTSYGAAFTAEDTYTFWAVNGAGNKSQDYVVTLDRSMPLGYIHSGDGGIVGDWTNAGSIYYIAFDANAFTVYVKKPDSDCYEPAENGEVYYDEGLYSFYSVDIAGNQSFYRETTIDRVKPVMRVYADLTEMSPGSYTNEDYIWALGEDNASGVQMIYVKKPGQSGFETYNNGELFLEGFYIFYCIDYSGNESDEFTVCVDQTKPTGQIYKGDIAVSNGSYITEPFCYIATDGFSGIQRIEIMRPDSGIWEEYTSGSIETGADGLYRFRTYDKANNLSDVSTVIYDTTQPIITCVTSGENVIFNNAFTNASSISFRVDETNPVTGYIKIPGANNFSQATINASYSAEGRYEFYAKDIAGNQSPVYSVTVDRQAPIGTVTVNGQMISNGGYVNKPFRFKATDNESGIDRYEFCRPNGDWEGYGENAEVSGIDGWYSFRAYDRAGNVSQVFEIYYDTTKPDIQIFSDGNEIVNGTYINAEYVFFIVNDASIDSLYVKQPDMESFVAAIDGENYMEAGRYEYYSVDTAGNVSDIYIVTIDRLNPEGGIYSNGNLLTNGAIINTPFYFTASDDFGLSKLEYKTPDGGWMDYDGNELSGVINGAYTFRAIDLAGNISEEYCIFYDTVKPVVTIYDGNNPVENGDFTNTEQLKFVPFDTNFYKEYIKLPGEIEFIECMTGLTFSASGYYEYYATDKAGNVSEVYGITIDKTMPIGFLYSNGETVPNGSYLHKPFSYSAEHEISGIARLEIRRPGGAWEEYIAGTDVFGNNGTYAFRAVSNAGNYSVENIVHYDTVMPEIKIFAGSNIVSSGSETGAAYIRFTATDVNLYVCHIKLPGESEYQSVSSGLQYTQSGLYEFYAEDKAGNISAVHTITLDKVGPMGTLLIDDSPVNSGIYTNEAFCYTGSDELTRVAYYEIKRPDSDIFEEYISGTTIIPASQNGKYIFRCIDAVGNISAESVMYLDSVSPTGQLYANEQNIDSHTFTNAVRIKFEGIDANSVSCYVKLPGTANFIQTANGAVYSDEGHFEFYAEDIAGNRSEIYIVIIDRTPKEVTLGNVIGGFTEKNVTVTWADAGGLASIVSVKVNGITVTNGKVIKIINGGVYEVETLDEAGNIWAGNFTAITTDILTSTTNKYWWEYKGLDQGTLAFENYENALAYGILDEKTLIRTSVWNNDVWDTGYIMDSVDAVNAKPGTFYIYKKWDDPNIDVAYFTLARLNAVVQSYAEKRITKYFYWEKLPATVASGNELYSLNNQKTIIAPSVSLSVNAKYLLNGTAFEGDKVAATGRHTLTVFDDWGNSYDFTLYIISQTPNLYFRDANGDYYLSLNDQPYYLKNRFTIKLTDSLDEYAVALVYNSAGDTLCMLNEGEEYIVSETGKYIIRAINHYGYTDYVFYISANTPKIITAEKETDKRLNISITSSSDKDIYLTLIMIEHSADGEEWVMLSADDYDNMISTGRLSYNFFKSGWYRITVEDTCRSGIDKLMKTVFYEKPAPEGWFNELGDNGYTNQSVSYIWTDEAYATVTFNGETTEYLSGSLLELNGEYLLIFCDYNGYVIQYRFVIDKQAPEVLLSREIINGYATESLSALWGETDVTATLILNGKVVHGYKSGDIIDTGGSYILKLIDLAGNETFISFILDTTAPALKLTGVDTNGTTKGVVKLSELSEEAKLTVYLNGTEISYRLGENLTALGTYLVVVTDLAGNTAEYNFEILYSYNAGSIVVIALAIVGAVGGVVAVIFMRRRKKFRTKK